MCVTKISIDLMINAVMLLASSRRLVFGRPVITLGLTGKSLFAVKGEQMKPNRRSSVSLVTETGMFLVTETVRWWSTLKSVVFGTSSSLPLLVSEGGGQVCESVGKADLLSDRFDSKQFWNAVDLSLTCHPPPTHTTFAFRSREIRRLLLDLDPYGGTDPLGMFPLFLKRTADVIIPHLSVVFRRLVRLGSFPPCWRQANLTPIPKGPTSSSVTNYRPISITSILSKMYERMLSVRLGEFVECNGVLPTTQFAYRKGLGTCDALLSVSHTLQSALESAQKARIVQIDFSAAFDRVDQGILYKLCSVGIGDSVLFILTQLLSNRSQHVMVDGCQSKLVDVSGVPQGSVLGPLLFLLYTSELFSILDNKLVGYADDSTLMGFVPSPGVRVTVCVLKCVNVPLCAPYGHHVAGYTRCPGRTSVYL